MSTSARPPIAVFVARFPLINETFILREINELERQGQPVILVPIVREKTATLHEEAKPWVSRALFTELFSFAIVMANLLQLLRTPVVYISLLARVIVQTLLWPSILVRNLAMFPKAIYLARELPKRGVRHIHAHFATNPTMMAYITSHFSPELTYSFTAHGPDTFVHRHLLEEKIRRATFVRTVSTFGEAFLSGLFPSATAGKIEMVHVGLDVGVYERADQASRPHSDKVSILSVAALRSNKAMHVLVDACARLITRGVNLQCTIVGSGPTRSKIEETIARKHVAQFVTLAGSKPQHEVAKMIADCDVFVLPSVIAPDGQMDGIPISLMEAMATARPVIAGGLAGIPELIRDGVSGFLVDATNDEQIADRIFTLANDRELAARMSAAGHETVARHFELRSTVARLISALDRHTGIEPLPLPQTREAQQMRVAKLHQRRDSVVAELQSETAAAPSVILKQQRTREGESRPAAERARHEFETLRMLRKNLNGIETQLAYVPEPITFDEASAVVTMHRAIGQPLDAIIAQSRASLSAPQLSAAVEGAGAWLHRMQSVTHSDEDGRHLLTALLVLARNDLELAAIASPALSRRRGAIIERLQRLEERVAAARPPVVGHHGDYWPGNIFVDGARVEVIDFEGFREGLPLEDVAYFLVQLELFYAYPFFHRAYPRLREAFFRGYGDAPSGEALELFVTTKALQILAHGSAGEQHGLRARWKRQILESLILGSSR